MSYVTFPNPTPVFPSLPGRGWSVHKRPTWASNVSVHLSGKEKVASRQCFPLWEFELTHEVLREQTQNITPYQNLSGFTELEQVSELFLSCYGQYGEFYFNDPEDNQRTNQFIGTGTGLQNIFIIYRSWGFGNLTTVEPVAALDLSFPHNVYVNGALINPANYTITWGTTYATIIFNTFVPSMGVGVNMDFNYFYRCRFIDDVHDYNQFYKNLWELKSCRFRTTKP